MGKAQRSEADAGKLAERRSSGVLWIGMLFGGLIALGLALAVGFREPAEEVVAPVEVRPDVAPPRQPASAIDQLRARVLRKFPHDREAFTQGLLWHDGALYESTGQYGRSTLRKVRLEDGKILQQRALARNFFGEGLARVDNRLIQLTWRSGLAFVSDLSSLEEQATLRYRGEGWGLCHDGAALVMSDGSSTLTFRDSASLAVLREVTVTREGSPVTNLNELECVGSDVYANVWKRNEIYRIDKQTGKVEAIIDASGLLNMMEAARANVLNGIAYKPDSKTFLLTGKLWPHVFEVELVPR